MRFMTEPIACPRCRHADLTSGIIVGRSPGVKFKRSKGLAGDLTGVPVTTGFFKPQRAGPQGVPNAARSSFYPRAERGCCDVVRPNVSTATPAGDRVPANWGLAVVPWRCHPGEVGATRVEEDAPAGDARLTAGVSAACCRFVAFVVVPSSVAAFALPPGVDAVWAMCGLLTIVLCPVVAGLCGYVSFTALWIHGGVLPDCRVACTWSPFFSSPRCGLGWSPPGARTSCLGGWTDGCVGSPAVPTQHW